MAVCKAQTPDWGEILYLESPGMPVTLGMQYRTTLQTAWLPSGSNPSHRAGKTRSGRRPPQAGLDNPNLTDAQKLNRNRWRKCADLWNALPAVSSNNPPCESMDGKDYWNNLRNMSGAESGYYDLFMQACMSCYRSTGCPCGNMYNLEPSPDEISPEPSTSYPIKFNEPCDPVSMVKGTGSWYPNIWLSPPSVDYDRLEFKDRAGALGCVNIIPSECTLIFDASNPSEINCPDSLTFWIIGGTPPFSWETNCDSIFWVNDETTVRYNTLSCLSCAPPCFALDALHVVDSVGCTADAQIAVNGTGYWRWKDRIRYDTLPSPYCQRYRYGYPQAVFYANGYKYILNQAWWLYPSTPDWPSGLDSARYPPCGSPAECADSVEIDLCYNMDLCNPDPIPCSVSGRVFYLYCDRYYWNC